MHMHIHWSSHTGGPEAAATEPPAVGGLGIAPPPPAGFWGGVADVGVASFAAGQAAINPNPQAAQSITAGKEVNEEKQTELANQLRTEFRKAMAKLGLNARECTEL